MFAAFPAHGHAHTRLMRRIPEGVRKDGDARTVAAVSEGDAGIASRAGGKRQRAQKSDTKGTGVAHGGTSGSTAAVAPRLNDARAGLQNKKQL